MILYFPCYQIVITLVFTDSHYLAVMRCTLAFIILQANFLRDNFKTMLLKIDLAAFMGLWFCLNIKGTSLFFLWWFWYLEKFYCDRNESHFQKQHVCICISWIIYLWREFCFVSFWQFFQCLHYVCTMLNILHTLFLWGKISKFLLVSRLLPLFSRSA